MWWRRLIVVLACLDFISSQPLTQLVSDAHAPIECCPCPGSERAAIDALGSASQPTGSPVLDRETDVDDCPCRVRDADSDGAPSLLLPRVLHPLQLDVKPEIKNEDVKPLLHPEVDLASSVLETLRDVTEEEYQEALARDSARNSVRALEDGPGHQMTDPGNADIVTIIVNPNVGEDDIIISEATHVHESKCAHPLGSSRSDLAEVKLTTNLLPTKGLLRIPKFESKSLSRRPFDMHNSASNAEEQVVSANRGLEGLKLKSTSSKLSEFLERAKSQILQTSNRDRNQKDFTSPKVPNLRLDSLLKKKNEQFGPKANEMKPSFHSVDNNIFSKINLSKTNILDSVSNLDSDTSPSNVLEQVSESLNQNSEQNNLKSFLAKDINKRPTQLKNLYKLRDFDLIVNKPTKIKIPSLKLTKSSQGIKYRNEPLLIESSCNQERVLETNIQNISPNSEQPVHVSESDVILSDKHPTFIETERNISEERMLDDALDSRLSTIQEDIGEDNVEANNKSDEVPEKIEDFDSFIKNGNFETYHEEEQESLEREGSSTSKEIIIQSNEAKSIESVELPREDDLQSEDHDSFVDATNNNVHFIDQDTDYGIEFEDKKIKNRTENEEFAELKPIENNGVLTLKEKMFKKMEDLKDEIAHIKNTRRQLKTAEIRDQGISKNPAKQDSIDAQTDASNLHIVTQELISTTELNDRRSSFDTFSENSRNLPKSSKTFSQEWNASVEPSQNMRDNVDERLDMNSSASSLETVILDSVSSPSESEENPQVSSSDLHNGSSDQDIMNDQPNSNESSIDKTCIADINKDIEKKEDDSKPVEMSSQASESISNIVPQASERQSILVQPPSLFGENSILRPLPNLLNLDTHIPTLDEIRSSLSGLLDIRSRGADDDEISAEFQSAEDCSSAMSTGASTISSKSIFPNIKPLEDINLDIFQLSPKSQKGRFKSRTPGLNLNSYKAKLALPQNIGFKPLRLESSLGKNGNLLGATLTFGPERIGSTKSKISGTSSFLDHARVPALKSSLPSLSHLGDIKTTMGGRAENLLGSQLSITPSHTVQKVSELTDNIRSHTENTVKNIQQTLASSLSESRIRDISLKEKFAKPSPEDLLEKLSTAREDMSDKLKALHADLADRLSSIHENIVEKTTLPTLQLPLFTPINRNSNPKFRTRPKSYSKQKTSDSNKRINKGGVSNIRSSASRGIDEIKVRPLKISKAASMLTPKTVEVPKLMTTSSKPPFEKAFHRDSNIKIKDSRHFESPMAVDKNSIPRNNFTPTKNNISLQNKPTLIQQFTSQRTIPRAPSAKDALRNRANLGSKSRLDDSRGFASEVKSAFVSAPVKSGAIVTENEDSIQTQINRSRPKSLFSIQNLGIPSQISTPATKPKNDQIPRTLNHKPFLKDTSSPLLSKMRESLVTRLSGQANIQSNSDDMARSATGNRKIEVRQEPLKENVKYRCRMVCVKEPIE